MFLFILGDLALHPSTNCVNNNSNNNNHSNNTINHYSMIESQKMTTKNSDICFNSSTKNQTQPIISKDIHPPIIQQQHPFYFSTNPQIQNNSTQPNLQNLYNTLKLQYPLFPPSYINSLFALQQPQPNSNEPVYQNNQLSEPQVQPANLLSKNTNMFSIENLFTSTKNEAEKPVISKPEPIKINNSVYTASSSKCCDHKEELFMLRKNVYKMLYKNLPNVLLAFNLVNDPLSPQIDRILQSLLCYTQETDDRFDKFSKENTLDMSKFFNQYSLGVNRPIFSTTT